MHLHRERSMIGVQCQLMIWRGHIRASKGTFQIFLWLMVLWQIGHRSTFLGQKHKSAIWDRTSPTYTSDLVYMCAGGFRGRKSSNRIELS